MLSDIYESKSKAELIADIYVLRAAVGNKENQLRQAEIKIESLKDEVQRLAIENVKLLNRGNKNANDFSSSKPMQDSIRERNVGADQPIHSGIGRSG